ncbi:hypothetical protein Cgig2_009333 [Carnegiea gigantea]|uniref:Signal peptidase complex subunit 3 n=1 Tax=Carnegiea gigantea TaxID=171969 RepID=A0A9Q1JJT7_9CARY|nr:hypothetical protein Cgig2_009333 [Carnegiea gigantea]
MHSFWFRLNALLTLSVTVLGIICALASLSDNFNHPSPSAIIEVLKIHKFQKLSSGNDEVKLTLNVTADLQSLFTWNTKQVEVSFSEPLAWHSLAAFCLPPQTMETRVQMSQNLVHESSHECLVFVFVAAEYETPKNAFNQTLEGSFSLEKFVSSPSSGVKVVLDGVISNIIVMARFHYGMQ